MRRGLGSAGGTGRVQPRVRVASHGFVAAESVTEISQPFVTQRVSGALRVQRARSGPPETPRQVGRARPQDADDGPVFIHYNVSL